MLRAIIVEDELANRETLANLLRQFCPGQVEVCGFAGAVVEAIALAQRVQPDLIFLDIELLGGSGFEVLEGLVGQEGFQVIFVTAYDEFAIQAIRHAALDYLLKPVDVDELIAAVKKARRRFEAGNLPGVTPLALPERPDMLSLPTQSGLHLLPPGQVVRCEAEGSYSQLILEDARPLILSKTLKELEEILPENMFMRVHRSHIVNLGWVRSYHPEEGGWLELRNGDRIPVSRRKRKVLREALRQL